MPRKSSSKARRQRDDRAFAEFDEMMKRLAKTTRRRRTPPDVRSVERKRLARSSLDQPPREGDG